MADACDVKPFAVWGFSFGGNIARYMGAWSKRITSLAIIGVPFGPAVDAGFDQMINGFMKKWEPLVQAYNQNKQDVKLLQKERKPIASGVIPVWLACFQAMRSWPSIEPGEIGCPSMLLAGTKNKNVIDWVKANREALDRANTHVEIIDGLTHLQEFTEIDRVFPIVSSFFKGKS